MSSVNRGMKYPEGRSPGRAAGVQPASAAADERRTPVNWDSPRLMLYESPSTGTGVRARDAIARGEPIGFFGGHVVPLSERSRLPAELDHFYFQVSEDLILTHVSIEQVRQSVIEFINHSCEPNVGFEGQIMLVALRDIQAGEIVAFDYATCTSEPGFRMECFCGAGGCRRLVTGEDWKDPELQARYRGFFQPYLERKFSIA